mmetsp:Transcript_28885/g.5232  ORF Transcript_28885/g.5232 Transcript_28885/m.5232 type:complete len:95 (-) Transcript_28885:1636-1920(-)
MFVALLTLVNSIHVNPNTRMLEDNFNRTVIFHGTNVVVKVPPFIPITSHFDSDMSVSAKDLEYMNEWGFNFVRLGVMWEAVERQPNWYNTTYLE